jgi:hypothetical protein
MKKIVLFTVFCAAVFFPAKAQNGYWSWSYWYTPVSWSEAKVYFQMGYGEPTGEESTIYIAGEGPLPDSDENNTIKFPFSYIYGGPYSWTLPWRQDGDQSKIGYKGYIGPQPESWYFTDLIIDEGITHIGNWWFAGLVVSDTVALPSSLQSVGEGAFKNCYNLPSFECSDKVKSIGGYAFEDCKKLKYFNFAANSTIGDKAFNRSGLKSIEFKPGISFGSYVFHQCNDLESVTIQDDNILGKSMFEFCVNLKSVTFLGRINAIAERTFFGCASLRSITIPNSVTKIGAGAFQQSGLTSVTVPNSVTYIGEGAFNYTLGLTSVTVPNSVTKLGARAFSQSGLTSITVPGSVKAIEESAFSWNESLTSAKICEGVKTIGKWAFQECGKLEKVILPASLDSIGEGVFIWCESLKVIECNSTTPPTMHPEVFFEESFAKTSLCVPYGSVEAYKKANIWKNFKHIGTYPAGIHIINGENFTVNSGAKIKLTAKLLPHDAVPAIVWTSSNSSVASIVDGTVTAHAPGETVITATTGNGIFKDECRITVKPGNNVPAL